MGFRAVASLFLVLSAILMSKVLGPPCTFNRQEPDSAAYIKGINVAFLVHNTGNMSDEDCKTSSSIVNELHRYFVTEYNTNCVIGMCLFNSNTSCPYPPSREHCSSTANLSFNLSLNTSFGTQISDALHWELMFDDAYHVHPNLCILVTTQPPSNTSLSKSTAARLRESGSNVVAIGVGDMVDSDDLISLASNEKAVFSVSSTDGVGVNVSTVTKGVSDLLEHGNLLPRYKWCYSWNINMYIIIDVQIDYGGVIKDLINFYYAFDSNVRIKLICNPEKFRNILREAKIRNTEYGRFSSIEAANTLSDGIRTAKDKLLSEGKETESPDKILLIAVDSFHNNTDEVADISMASKRQGVKIMTLGLGTEVRDSDLLRIASEQRGTMMLPPDQDLGYGLGKLYFSLCGEPCDHGWVHHDDKCYQYVTDDTSWEGAKRACERWGSHLVSVTDRETHNWIRTEFLSNGNASIFIGLRKHVLTNPRAAVSSQMRWENGKPLIFEDCFENFSTEGSSHKRSRVSSPAEPDGGSYESCVAWYPDGWRDVVCSLLLGAHYICKRDTLDKIPTQNTAANVRPLWAEEPCVMFPFEYKMIMEWAILHKSPHCPPTYVTHLRKPDLRDIYNCSNGELVHNSVLCDGKQDCKDSSDENNCDTECSEYQFQCGNGQCVSLTSVCDTLSDCVDDSDELNCVFPPCGNDMWQCDSGQCIYENEHCDLIYDCLDKSDEAECSDQIRRSFECNDGSVIPAQWITDGMVDCSGGEFEDEHKQLIVNQNYQLCFSGEYQSLTYIYGQAKYEKELLRCTMMIDMFGKRYSSWNVSTDLCDEDDLFCPIGFYRCPSSYCIPIERVCDGSMDCVNGEDEFQCGGCHDCVNGEDEFQCGGCHDCVNGEDEFQCGGCHDCVNGEDEFQCENYICPGYFRCPGTNLCHHPARICDGAIDCPGGKDEISCDYYCPMNCTCTSGFVECRHVVTNQTSPVFPSARKVVITDSLFLDPTVVFRERHGIIDITLISSALINISGVFTDQINLMRLNLSHNKIETLVPKAFAYTTKLRVLDVSHNPIRNIEQFSGLHQLEELYIRQTMIKSIHGGTFASLVKLRLLDMTGQSLQMVADQSFIGLVSLNILYMQGNPVWDFGRRSFEGLESLNEFHTDVFSLCCPQVRPSFLPDDKCISPESSISSCNDLLSSDILRSSIWILCIAALVGNVVSTIIRLIWERRSMRNGFGVFVTHLGIADFLMGIYLLIIAVADTTFTGTYIWHDFEWRNSVYCSIAGALSAFSSEASAFFIVLITLDRFMVIKFPYGQTQFRYRSASISAGIAWLLAAIIAGVPLLPSLRHWNFYSKNGACLALPFSTEREPGWIYSVVIFTGLNFTAFLAIAIGQMSIYRAMKGNSMKISSKDRRAQDMAVARGLLLIVTTDFLCWFPIGIMSVLALCGVAIGGEVFAWTAVFILPVNSALNPFLYTIPAVLKGREARKHKEGRKDTSSAPGVTIIESKVVFGEPSPEDVLLEDVLMKMSSREERINLVYAIWTAILKPLSTLSPEDSQPNTVYLKINAKLPSKIILVRRDDNGRNGLTYLPLLINCVIEENGTKMEKL